MSKNEDVILENLKRLRSMAHEDLNNTARAIFHELTEPKTDQELRRVLHKFYDLGNIQDGLSALNVNMGTPPEIKKPSK